MADRDELLASLRPRTGRKLLLAAAVVALVVAMAWGGGWFLRWKRHRERERQVAAEQAFAQIVSEHYFSLMPATPVVGRLLAPADANTPGVPVVIAEAFWRTRYGANPALETLPLVIGQTTVAVVGVVPTGFQGPGGVFEPDLWVPLSALPSVIRHQLPGAPI